MPHSELETLAAVDLGSNSFHLLIARRTASSPPRTLDRLREMVQLGAGLDEQWNLTPEAMQRALDCLARFGQRLRSLGSGKVRVVATNTLRQARNATVFLDQAERALGHPIEIISGIEEARLIYLGVAHSLAMGHDRRRLVMDIGGGSTEFVIGEGMEPRHMESTSMGCVSMSRRFFAGGHLSATALRAAELAALQELEPHQTLLNTLGWSESIGASGTIRAIGRVLREAGWSNGGITADALERLSAALVRAGHVDNLKLSGLSERRRSVFPGGVAILSAAFAALGIERMRVAEGALREGVLFDLIGRLDHDDVRDRGIEAALGHYRVDRAHALRVGETADSCFQHVAETWQLSEIHRQQLGWAALLHEVGLSIAHSQYHRHGAYIVANADLLGFSRREQLILALLVRSQRRKFLTGEFRPLAKTDRTPAIRLARLLRLAVTLRRSRSPDALPPFSLTAKGKRLTLHFPPGWLEGHPLTRADLQQEAGYLADANHELILA